MKRQSEVIKFYDVWHLEEREEMHGCTDLISTGLGSPSYQLNSTNIILIIRFGFTRELFRDLFLLIKKKKAMFLIFSLIIEWKIWTYIYEIYDVLVK